MIKYEFIGLTNNWEMLCKKTNELFEEKKFNTIEFTLKTIEKYKKQLEEKMYFFTVIENKNQLKIELNTCSKYYLNSQIKQYDLYMIEIKMVKILLIIAIFYD